MSHAAEAPKPPDDPELRNIIDKLAQFVARNGPDFENMTKQKQKDNARFGFLFGGEYFHYYMYKVNAEQAIMRKQKMQAEQNSLAQIQTLQQQIHESEKNLKLQYDVLMQQQPTQIDDAIRIAEQEHLRDVANELKINFDDFSIALEQMHESCTKEAISLNKNWFFNHYSSQRHAEVILNFLVNKAKDPSVPFLFKLHLLYLVNDLTHHYMRKQNEPMLNLLGRFVVTMFTCAYTTHSSDEQQKEKLEKLRSIWEAQRYFSDDTLKKLSNVQDTYSDYQANLRQEYSSTVAEVQAKIQSQYKQFELQHVEYAKHIQQQISSLETRKINPPVTPFTPNLQLQSLSRGLLGTSPNTPPVLSGDSGGPSQPPARRSRFDAAPMSAAGPLPVNIPPPAIAQPSLSSAVRSNFPPMNQNAPPPLNNMGHGGLPPPMVPPWQQGPPPGSCHPPPFSTRGPPPQLQTMAPPPAMYDFPPFPPNRNAAPPGMPPMNMQQSPRPLFPPASGLSGPPPRLGGPPPMGPGPGAPSVPPWNPQMGPTPPPPGPGGMPSSWPPPNQAPLRPMAPLNNNSPIRQPPPPLEDVSLIPKAAYYDLPAGLMVPLVKLEDHGYKSLDPSKIRLPPPMPPSERLLAAVEAFYAPPNHENPRDSEGWERLGLYEYFKAKQAAVQGSKVDDASRDYGRTDSRRSPPSSQRRSRSYSRSDSRSRSRSRTASPRSRSRNSRSDSRSRHNTRSSRSRSRSKSRSRSRSRSMSRSPDRRRHRRSRSLSHSRSPPPKFSSDRRRGESSSNVNESGSSGSFYQGLGASSGNDDPFENFRKAQSGMFIQRIRAADPRTKHPPVPEQLN